MLLEMDNNELIQLIEDQGLMDTKIQEAVTVLKYHEDNMQNN